MGRVKVKIGAPKIYEFGSDDLVIDIDAGDIYFKDRKGKLRKILSQDTSPPLPSLPQFFSPTISASFAVITKNITASGDISASGTIYANTFESHGSTEINIIDSINVAGHITASGNIIGSTGSFAQTVITLESGAEDSPFIIKIADNNGQDNKLEVTKDGITKYGSLDTLPTAITGGLVYSSSAFYMGI